MEQRYLEERVSRLRGKIGFYYENLETGETLTYNGDEVFKAASVIKLPVFMCVAKLVKEGQLSWDQKFLVREEDKMPSCGALLSLTGNVEIDIESLCRLMMRLCLCWQWEWRDSKRTLKRGV